MPGENELRRAGMSPASIRIALNVGSIKEVASLLGLVPNVAGGAHRQKYSKELLVELLRDFFAKYGRLPGAADYRMRLIPHGSSFITYFGSMSAAYDAAGLKLASQEKVA